MKNQILTLLLFALLGSNVQAQFLKRLKDKVNNAVVGTGTGTETKKEEKEKTEKNKEVKLTPCEILEDSKAIIKIKLPDGVIVQFNPIPYGEFKKPKSEGKKYLQQEYYDVNANEFQQVTIGRADENPQSKIEFIFYKKINMDKVDFSKPTVEETICAFDMPPTTEDAKAAYYQCEVGSEKIGGQQYNKNELSFVMVGGKDDLKDIEKLWVYLSAKLPKKYKDAFDKTAQLRQELMKKAYIKRAEREKRSNESDLRQAAKEAAGDNDNSNTTTNSSSTKKKDIGFYGKLENKSDTKIEIIIHSAKGGRRSNTSINGRSRQSFPMEVGGKITTKAGGTLVGVITEDMKDKTTVIAQ